MTDQKIYIVTRKGTNTTPFMKKIFKVGECPPLSKVDIRADEQIKTKHLKDFHDHCFPSSVEGYQFERFTLDPQRKCKFLTLGFYRILPRIQKNLWFDLMIFSRKDFQNVITGASNWEVIRFYSCDILASKLRFPKSRKFKIQELDFDECGDQPRSNWKKYPKRFNSIIKAIAQSKMKNSLKVIKIKKSKLVYKDVKDKFSFYKMDKISIR